MLRFIANVAIITFFEVSYLSRLEGVTLKRIYVTGFAKRGLPHTSNSMNLEDHNIVFKEIQA